MMQLMRTCDCREL